MTATYEDTKEQLLDAILDHVPFDGWSESGFRAAIDDCDLDVGLARAICPRGAVDLALAFHARGDRAMQERIKTEDLSGLKFRDKIAAAVRFRLQAVDNNEAVRRGVTLFALPIYAADGAKAVWGTCDLIWNALGDSSDDVNWYTKRATLSGVYSSTLLYWLGDDSPNYQATWDFLDRRIEGVMQFEKLKAQVNGNPLLKPFLAVPNWLAGHVKAPVKMSDNLPGSLSPRK
ncbi:COQ9 family protein [uncultured Ruegeria sp.]|uniref:COQ9 family protein n=1 Tax=uncultured Ruegeria sp. TaxID=259304 RepID=UPI002617D3CA|nr:COQ9 family protein [uncultured Ruegeria sp.]